jgi:hypothetical protein
MDVLRLSEGSSSVFDRTCAGETRISRDLCRSSFEQFPEETGLTQTDQFPCVFYSVRAANSCPKSGMSSLSVSSQAFGFHISTQMTAPTRTTSSFGFTSKKSRKLSGINRRDRFASLVVQCRVESKRPNRWTSRHRCSIRPLCILCLINDTPSSIRFCHSEARHKLRHPYRSFIRIDCPASSVTACAISGAKLKRYRSSNVRLNSPSMYVSTGMNDLRSSVCSDQRPSGTESFVLVSPLPVLGIKPTRNSHTESQWAQNPQQTPKLPSSL